MIRLIIFDIDGVLTDGSIIIDDQGREQKKINLKDIDSIFELKRRGFLIAAITGEMSTIVSYFKNRFPWDYFYSGEKHKLKTIQQLEVETGVSSEEICYIGDGKYDVEPLRYVQLGICPADAIDLAKQAADVILKNTGGTGCLWEIVEIVQRYNTPLCKEYYFMERLEEHRNIFKKISSDIELMKKVMNIGERILDIFEKNGQVLLCGNGGSASDAQHIATEFISRFYRERPAMNAEALSVNTSTLTAVGNDYSFERVFVRQLEAKAHPGDMIIGISTSGKSKNVLEALRYAKECGMVTVMWMGDFDNIELEEFVDYLVKVPSKVTPRIQETHIFIGHLIAEYVEHKKYGGGVRKVRYVVMIKLSDYVFQFLKDKGIQHVFMLPGGGAMHLVDSLGNSGIEYICCLHEQAASIAAEAYGQHTNDVGVVLTTSGPGATNAITGVTAGWIDSTPMFVISGQAKRSDLVGDSGVRQIGSQEVQIIDMVKPITKYAVQIMKPEEIYYHMERAYQEATTGRPGPVWLSIPLDVQAAMIEPVEKKCDKQEEKEQIDIKDTIENVIKLLKNSNKPLFLAGNGIKLSNGIEDFYKLIEAMQIPVLTTWKTIDLFGEDEWLYLGHPGSMGDRGANLILQEADLLISIGSRIDTSLTAFNESHFGKNAKKVVVDIDIKELERMALSQMEVVCACDAKKFIQSLHQACNKHNWEELQEGWKSWIEKSHKLRNKYPTVTQAHRSVTDFVSAYYFIDVLCRNLNAEDVIVPESSGGAGEITYQAFKIKKGQKMKNAAGLGSMGFGLPYAIGACVANKKRRTILINGDGAFQMNIQELQTIVRLQLPIKIFIWNNGGYASIRSMQKNIFNGHFVASGESSGLTMPEIYKIANSYGIPTFVVKNNTEMEEVLPYILKMKGTVLCELYTSPEEVVSPRTKSYRLADGSMVSSLLEKMWPLAED